MATSSNTLTNRFHDLASLCGRDAEDARDETLRMELLRRQQAFLKLAAEGVYEAGAAPGGTSPADPSNDIV
jgi:hypothetical protein